MTRINPSARKRKRGVLPRCAAMLSLLTVWPGSVLAESLPDAVQAALRETPRIEAARRSLKAVQERKGRAISGYLPSLDLSMGSGEEWNNTTSTRPVEGENHLRRGELQVNLNQPLFDGFSTWHQMAENDAKETAEQAALDSASDEVVLDTVLAYLEVLKQRELQQLLREQEQHHRQILSRVRDMASLGLSTSVDAELSDSRLRLILSDLVSANGAVQKAVTRYQRMVGREPGPLEPPGVPSGLPTSLQQAEELALQLNPSLRRSKGELASTRATHAGNYSRYWPKLGLDVGYSNTDNVGGVRGYNENMRAMVRLNVNLFHGGSDLATVRESAEQVGRSQGLLDDARDTVVEEVRVAWERRQIALERLARLDDHLESKQKVTSAYHEQFRMGLRPLLDVLNAENELTTARNTRVNEFYEHLSSGYRLLAAMGTLRQAFPSEGSAPTPAVRPFQEMAEGRAGKAQSIPASVVRDPSPVAAMVREAIPASMVHDAGADALDGVDTLDEASELLWQESSAIATGSSELEPVLQAE
ncbi:MAG: TolC family outer membrane protein [Magnetococcales bacterium]|nr:TolC family outer membrane protein [Magnetococcales bacterium]